MPYISGEYYVVCARCSKRGLRSDFIKDTTQGELIGGKMVLVCKDHFDGIHPANIPRPVRQPDPKPLRPELTRPLSIVYRTDTLRDLKWGDMGAPYIVPGLKWGSTDLTWGAWRK